MSNNWINMKQSEFAQVQNSIWNCNTWANLTITLYSSLTSLHLTENTNGKSSSKLQLWQVSNKVVWSRVNLRQVKLKWWWLIKISKPIKISKKWSLLSHMLSIYKLLMSQIFIMDKDWINQEASSTSLVKTSMLANGFLSSEKLTWLKAVSLTKMEIKSPSHRTLASNIKSI